jgi:hypothetical protein
MKKIISVTIIAVCFCFFILPSCDDTETYADKLKKERSAINRFLSAMQIKVIEEYPKDRLFEEKEFFLDPNSGVYFHVIDSGNGRKATAGRTVYVRYKQTGSMIVASSTEDFTDSNTATPQDYLYFTYGDATTYIDYTASSTYSNYMYKSEGVIAPLKYLGDSAIVQLIVPFKVGSGYQQSSYEAIYFGWLFYDFRKEQGE